MANTKKTPKKSEKKRKYTKPTVAERHKKVAKKVIENGGSVAQAMREEGYSEAYVKNPHKLTRSKTWQELLQEYIPQEALAQKHGELLEATTKLHKIVGRDSKGNPEYDFIDVPDNTTQTRALDMGYKLHGSYAPKHLVFESKYQGMSDAELQEIIESGEYLDDDNE